MGLGEKTICSINDKWCPRSGLIVYVIKMAFAITFDILDFFVGIVFGVLGFATPTDVAGTLYDAIGIPVAVALFGYEGVLYAGELVAGSYLNIADAFIPSMTIIGIIHGVRKRPWEMQPEDIESTAITIKPTK